MSTREPFTELAELSRSPLHSASLAGPWCAGEEFANQARICSGRSPISRRPHARKFAPGTVAEVITAAGSATLRRGLVNVPARFGAPARKPFCTCQPTGPRMDGKPCAPPSLATASLSHRHWNPPGGTGRSPAGKARGWGVFAHGFTLRQGLPQRRHRLDQPPTN
jgi:hypothetical protein